MSKETLKANLREIADFPIPGILFYDVTTLFKNLPRWTRGWKRKSKLTKPCSPFGMSSTLH